MNKLAIKYFFKYFFYMLITIVLAPKIAYDHISFEYNIESRRLKWQ